MSFDKIGNWISLAFIGAIVYNVVRSPFTGGIIGKSGGAVRGLISSVEGR